MGSLLGEDIGESYTVYAFDITLIDEDGNSLQPTDGMVSISVSGLELGDIVRVVHVHGAAGAPMPESCGGFRCGGAVRAGGRRSPDLLYRQLFHLLCPQRQDGAFPG